MTSHRGTLNALAKKGLIRYFPKTRRWQITRRGQEEYHGILKLRLEGGSDGRYEGNSHSREAGITGTEEGSLFNREADQGD